MLPFHQISAAKEGRDVVVKEQLLQGCDPDTLFGAVSTSLTCMPRGCDLHCALKLNAHTIPRICGHL